MVDLTYSEMTEDMQFNGVVADKSFEEIEQFINNGGYILLRVEVMGTIQYIPLQGHAVGSSVTGTMSAMGGVLVVVAEVYANGDAQILATVNM